MSDRTTQRRTKHRAAKLLPQAGGRTRNPESRSAFSALKKSLRSKPATGYRVGTITEDNKYGGDRG
jgi:hypothetical protein